MDTSGVPAGLPVTLFVLMIFSTVAFCGAILSNAVFFRHSDTPLHRVGAAFLIPMTISVYGLLVLPKLPISRVLYSSEFLLAAMLAVMLLRKLRLSQSAAWFLAASLSAGGCTLLNQAVDHPLMHLDPKIYAFIAFAGSILPVLIRHTEKEHHTFIQPFLLLGVSQLLALFDQNPMLLSVALLLKIGFYYQIVRAFSAAIHDEIMKEVEDARKIQKDFSEELRKEVKKQVFYMEQTHRKMAQISQTDALTGALNRKGVLDTIDRLIDDRALKHFSILLFDIDKFKGINDTMGHVVGDKCLKELCRIARSNLRDEDSLGRYGGDEFIIVLPHAGVDTAFSVAERFRQRVQETNDPHFTISVGIAAFPADGRTHKQLLEYADQGLYISKERGRNSVSRKNNE